MYRSILLPNDGSPISHRAVKQGVALAKEVGAKVVGFFAAEDYRLLYANLAAPIPIDDEAFEADARQMAARQLKFVERTAKAAGVAYEGYYVVSVTPWQAIVEAARKKRCDLIVMGSHGRSGLAAVVLGSQTTKVLTHSRVPVLVTR